MAAIYGKSPADIYRFSRLEGTVSSEGRPGYTGEGTVRSPTDRPAYGKRDRLPTIGQYSG